MAVINFVMKQASDFVVVGPFLQALTNMLAFYDTELIMAVKNYDTRLRTTLLRTGGLSLFFDFCKSQ